MNLATNSVRGVSNITLGQPGLLDPAGVHHRDPVAHRQRLLLVVGDEDERDAERPLEVLQLHRCSRRSFWSSAASGSSSSSTCGRSTSERATATRCRCPPESWCG